MHPTVRLIKSYSEGQSMRPGGCLPIYVRNRRYARHLRQLMLCSNSVRTMELHTLPTSIKRTNVVAAVFARIGFYSMLIVWMIGQLSLAPWSATSLKTIEFNSSRCSRYLNRHSKVFKRRNAPNRHTQGIPLASKMIERKLIHLSQTLRSLTKYEVS